MRSVVRIYPGPPFGLHKLVRFCEWLWFGFYDPLKRRIAGDNSIGALAQLGEHLLCKQRVVGSIPTGSTIIQDKKDTSLASWFEHGSPVCWISYIVKKKTNLEGSSLCEGHVKTCSAARSEPLPF